MCTVAFVDPVAPAALPTKWTPPTWAQNPTTFIDLHIKNTKVDQLLPMLHDYLLDLNPHCFKGIGNDSMSIHAAGSFKDSRGIYSLLYDFYLPLNVIWANSSVDSSRTINDTS